MLKNLSGVQSQTFEATVHRPRKEEQTKKETNKKQSRRSRQISFVMILLVGE